MILKSTLDDNNIISGKKRWRIKQYSQADVA